MSLRDDVAKRRAERDNGKPDGIAAVRAQKQATREGGLAALRKQRTREQKLSSKLDFNIGGIRYHSAHVSSEEEWTKERPWGRVSVSNGDLTFTFHNQYGSWMCNLDGRRMAEPAAVARALGTQASQLEVAQALNERWYRELKAHGIPTPEERVRQREEQARQQRRSNRNTNDDKE